MKYKRVTPEERIQLIERVTALKKEGRPLVHALKEVGIPYTTWHYWKRKGLMPDSEAAPVQMIVHGGENPAPVLKRTYQKRGSGKGLVLMMGTPEQLAEFYQAVSRE